jgi:hypothetical protein
MSDSTAISVSANAYQFDQLKINNGAGTNINLKSGQTQIIPLIISGIYKFKKHPQHAFGYAILTKHQTGIKMSARNDTRMNVINDSNNAGDEEFLGQYNIKSSLNEQWFGGTYSCKVAKHVALGITAFGAYRTQSLERSYVARVTPDITSFYSQYVAQLGSYSEIKSLEYSHLRAFSKLGLALDYSKFKFGLTITTPGIHLVGTGTYSRDEQINNLNYNNANLTTYTAGATTYNQLIVKVDSFKTKLDSYSINDRQTTDGDKMKVNYKSPLSIGLGFEYGFKSSKLCFSAEWFAPILDYDIIAPVKREVIRPKNAKYNYTSIDFLTIREGARGVVNFALAYEQSITKKIDLLGSFRTNFSSSPYSLPEYGDAISQTYWNITHYTLGVNYKKTKSDISIGFSFANGTRRFNASCRLRHGPQ